MLCSPSDSHSDDMHMQLLHAHSAQCHATVPCTFSTMSCNCSMQIQHLHVLAHARPTMSCIPLVGASVSEPHIDEFNVNFLYFYISIFLYFYIYIVRRAVNHFLLLFARSLLKLLQRTRYSASATWTYTTLHATYKPR